MSETKALKARRRPLYVHVIESPGSADLLDGRTEGRTLGAALELAGIPHRYHLATNLEALTEALGARMHRAMVETQQLPVLHLSAHGNRDGIALTSGEFLKWNELRILLIPLLRYMKGGLLVSLSACQGAYGVMMAMNEDDVPPFWGLVASSHDTEWADAAVAYVTFYHLLFKGHNVPDCVEAMKTASGDSHFTAIPGAYVRDGWVDREKIDRALDEVAKEDPPGRTEASRLCLS